MEDMVIAPSTDPAARLSNGEGSATKAFNIHEAIAGQYRPHDAPPVGYQRFGQLPAHILNSTGTSQLIIFAGYHPNTTDLALLFNCLH
jgi:hypothetical protein